MQIEIQIDSQYREPKIIILADSMTEEVNNIVKKLSEETPHLLAGFQEGSVQILEQSSIIRCYTANGKTFAATDSGEFALRLRLYELEERLDKGMFVRISNSEIINLKRVKRFDFSMAGTICVAFQNGTVTYVSRRYISKIKQVLGI